MSKIKGIYAARMSVFNDDLSLNIEKTINHAEKIIDHGLPWRCYFWKHWTSTTYISK